MVQDGQFKSGSALSEYMYHCNGIEGAVLVMQDGRRVKFKTYWWKHRRNEVERRVSGARWQELRQAKDVRVQRQQGRGKHKSVRGVVIGEVRRGLQYYRRHCEGVRGMVRLKERVGKAVKVFLIFDNQDLRDKAIAAPHKDLDGSYFRIVAATSNRAHSNEKWELEHVSQ